MKKARGFSKSTCPDNKANQANPNFVVFCDKRTGIAQFQARIDAGVDSNWERIAGLLAMQCLVRGQTPKDFILLVPAEKSVVSEVIFRAGQLLDAGRSIICPPSLSPRQRDVFQAVLSRQANKEIASRMNIAERTVKFHVSTLLAKFGVTSRSELARRAAELFLPAALTMEDVPQLAAQIPTRNHFRESRSLQGTTPHLAGASVAQVVRLPRRILSA